MVTRSGKNQRMLWRKYNSGFRLEIRRLNFLEKHNHLPCLLRASSPCSDFELPARTLWTRGRGCVIPCLDDKPNQGVGRSGDLNQPPLPVKVALGKSREKRDEDDEFDAKAYAIYLLTEGSITEKARAAVEPQEEADPQGQGDHAKTGSGVAGTKNIAAISCSDIFCVQAPRQPWSPKGGEKQGH